MGYSNRRAQFQAYRIPEGNKYIYPLENIAVVTNLPHKRPVNTAPLSRRPRIALLKAYLQQSVST